MASSTEEEYAAFQEKVKRTIYVDNLSPQVTESVMKVSFNQFGNVQSVQFIPNYLQTKNMPQAALVEMGHPDQAQKVISQMENYPFMIAGMPRPVRALNAKPEMFDQRPIKPGRRIRFCWLDPKDPDFQVAKKIKKLVERHSAEASLLLEEQLKQEEKLHKVQDETLKAHYKKFKLINGVFCDGSAKQLARRYNINIPDN